MKPINEFLKNTRHRYDKGYLAEHHLVENPLKQFENWMQEAIAAGVPEPNAMDLCTISENAPSSRIVLLKTVDERGFVFYSNYESRKGKEMAINSNISLNFFWQLQARQVRIEGQVEKVPSSESDDYFQSRPRESQIGAWASAQSTVLSSRKELEERIQLLTSQYLDKEIPRPSHWGGYVLRPVRIEFWQGRLNRLHDRFLYENSDQTWNIYRLSP